MNCSICGARIEKDSTFEVLDDGTVVCTICACHKVGTCRRCGTRIKFGEDLCEHCKNEIFRKNINSYSTTVNIFINKVNTNKCLNNRYYGMELEYSNMSGSMCKYFFKDMYDNKLIYNCSDASLDCGTEIKFVPMTKNKLKNVIKEMKTDRLSEHVSISRLTYNAGVHIHVSENTISRPTQVKLAILLNHACNSMFKVPMYYLSGRIDTLNSPSYNDSYYTIGSYAKVREILNSHGHDIALNFTDKGTLEFRLFKSTCETNKLCAYIDIVDSMIEFADSNPINKMLIPNFIKHLYNKNIDNEYLKVRLDKIKEHHQEYFDNDYIAFKHSSLLFEKFNSMNIEDLLHIFCYAVNRDIERVFDLTEEPLERLRILSRTDFVGPKKNRLIKYVKGRIVKEIKELI